ncbi:MAG: riboflavin biosynthesis protein RibF [Muribaculaceae bacterium]|nr:riboflavin biosynthesis protein RibF [Muribaculaceae bacterium]
MSTVAAVGMFDGVHPGHQKVLRATADIARRTGRRSQAFTFATHPLAILSPERAPAVLTDVGRRAELIAATGIDTVTVLDYSAADLATTAREFLLNLRKTYDVEALVMGYDNTIGSDRLAPDQVRSLVPEIISSLDIVDAAHLADGTVPSSSAIRAAIAATDMPRAAELAGTPFTIRGNVAEGRRIGRTIGFPTANVVPLDSRQLLPPDGVYAVNVTMPDGTVRRAVANIGFRPTLDDGRARTLEVHIPGFSGDLYGSRLDVAFLRYLRPERRFATLTDLAAQLRQDTALSMSDEGSI